MISLDEFKRIELRIGEVRAAEPMAGSERLLKLTVDFGEQTRTLVGGLAKSYSPEELLGLKVVVVTNLESARIRGVVSEGMLLCANSSASEEAASVSLVTVHRPVANGARVR